MNNDCARILIVGVPGRMQESLRTLLNAIPKFEIVEAESGRLSSFERMAVDTPDLVLLDFGLPAPEATAALAWIKSNWASARCLVFANTAQQKLAAKMTGADCVLLKGFSAAEFFVALGELLKGKVTLNLDLSDPKAPDETQGMDRETNTLGAPRETFVKTHPLVF